MLTVNCDTHPLLRHLHKPERGSDGRILPPERQDKRTVVPLDREVWDAWLHGTPEQAAALLRLPGPEVYEAAPADPSQQAGLPRPG